MFLFRTLTAVLLLISIMAGCSVNHRAELDPVAFLEPRPRDGWSPNESALEELEAHRGMSRLLSQVQTAIEAPVGEVSLLHLSNFALRNRPETRAAWERARVAAAQLGIARGAWYPTLGIDTEFSWAKIEFPATGSLFLIRQALLQPSLNLNYVLLDFGRREADDDHTRAALWAANLTYNRMVQETIHDVQIGYFALDTALALKEAAERNLELALTIVEMVEEKMEVGLATMPMVLMARQDLAQARFDVAATLAGISESTASLLLACGLPATTPITIARLGPEDVPPALEVRIEKVIEQALAGRPDLAAAVARVRVADAGVRRAEAEFYPQVSIFGSISGYATRFQTNVGDFENGSPDQHFPFTNATGSLWNVGVTGTWMVFEGFQRENALRGARAARREAAQMLRALRLATISETWDAYYDVEASSRQYAFGEALLASSDEAFDAINAAFQQGLATITQLVQAEKDLQQARATLVETRASLLTAASDLAFAAALERGRFPSDPSSDLPRAAP